MKDNSIFEKARMNTAVIPLAGFIIAAALALFIIFTAAYAGAFTTAKEDVVTRQPSFEEPEMPVAEYGLSTVDEHPSVYLNISLLNGLVRSNGKIKFRLQIQNPYNDTAHVEEVRCLLYKDGKSVGSFLISEAFDMGHNDSVILSGTEDDHGGYAALFYISWTDQNGLRASRYIKSE